MRTLFIALLVIFGLAWILRLSMPYLLRLLAKRMMKNMNQQPPKNEGEVTIDDSQEQSSEIPDDIGEYTDFEEVNSEDPNK